MCLDVEDLLNAAVRVLTRTKKVNHIAPVIDLYSAVLFIIEYIPKSCCWFIKH